MLYVCTRGQILINIVNRGARGKPLKNYKQLSLKLNFKFELVCLQFFRPRLDPDRVTRILDLDLDINYYNSNPTEKYFKDTVVCFILSEQNSSSCRGPAVKETFNFLA